LHKSGLSEVLTSVDCAAKVWNEPKMLDAALHLNGSEEKIATFAKRQYVARIGVEDGPNRTLNLLITLHRSVRQTVACKSTHERNMLSQSGDAYVVCATDLAERNTGQDHHFLIF
jgi:hypothetical protein